MTTTAASLGTDQPTYIPAISDPDVCPRCRAHQCELVCPTGCYATRPDGRMELDVSRCVSCRACVVICYELSNIAWLPGPSTRD